MLMHVDDLLAFARQKGQIHFKVDDAATAPLPLLHIVASAQRDGVLFSQHVCVAADQDKRSLKENVDFALATLVRAFAIGGRPA